MNKLAKKANLKELDVQSFEINYKNNRVFMPYD